MLEKGLESGLPPDSTGPEMARESLPADPAQRLIIVALIGPELSAPPGPEGSLLMKTGESTETRPAGLRSGPLDHATQVPPGKDMNMEVGHLLMRVGAVVGKEAVTALNHAEVPGDGADGAEKTRNLRVRGVLGEIIHGHVGPFGKIGRAHV